MAVIFSRTFPDFHGVTVAKKRLTKEKAAKILDDGKVRGKPISKKQKKFFGAVASGEKPCTKDAGNQNSPFTPALSEHFAARGKLNRF